ncbi:MAG: C40 family peptidase, partial [Flavobacteriaceae bacterium]|nr:C40 family peptidase [Flavobacteriaceae bacterium]
SLKILDKEGDFYQVQTPDGYISWVDHGGITKMTPETFESWEQAPKIIYTQNTGYVYRNTTDNKIISDIVFGGLLRYMAEVGAFYKVQYPDYRIGYIRKTESSPYSIWQENRTRNAESFIAKSSQLLGTPYLWGGTSTKGMDCSGFTKTVYLMHGFIIPRDASQQIMVGKTVDKAL